MEILSKLWVAMTTENETIVDIMSIFLLLIEMPLILEFFLAVLRIPATLKQKRIYMVITVPIGLLCIFYSKAIQQHYYYDNYSIYNNESL